MIGHTLWLVASGIGIAVLAALALVYRRAARQTALEDAQRFVEEDMDE
jgi:hypothetical protein